MDNKYGVITEQGDLGLGFDVLNDQDQKVYQEAVDKRNGEENKSRSNTVINERKDNK